MNIFTDILLWKKSILVASYRFTPSDGIDMGCIIWRKLISQQENPWCSWGCGFSLCCCLSKMVRISTKLHVFLRKWFMIKFWNVDLQTSWDTSLHPKQKKTMKRETSISHPDTSSTNHPPTQKMTLHVQPPSVGVGSTNKKPTNRVEATLPLEASLPNHAQVREAERAGRIATKSSPENPVLSYTGRWPLPLIGVNKEKLAIYKASFFKFFF